MEFQDVTFAYPGTRKTLEHFNYVIKRATSELACRGIRRRQIHDPAAYSCGSMLKQKGQILINENSIEQDQLTRGTSADRVSGAGYVPV